jgi:ribosomal protein S18 acetylase RimI-like enzyme
VATPAVAIRRPKAGAANVRRNHLVDHILKLVRPLSTFAIANSPAVAFASDQAQNHRVGFGPADARHTPSNRPGLIKGDERYQHPVSSEARCSGVAAALIAEAEARLAERDVGRGRLACAVGNDRAARFYENSFNSAGKSVSRRLGP